MSYLYYTGVTDYDIDIMSLALASLGAPLGASLEVSPAAEEFGMLGAR